MCSTKLIRRRIAGSTLSKVLTGGPQGYTGPFSIHYACDQAHTGDVSVNAGSFQTISGIPTGTQCTVSEPSLPSPPDGYTFGTPTFSPSDFGIADTRQLGVLTKIRALPQ
mgnify:CR=1 FL=1